MRAYIADLKARLRPLESPYLTALAGGEMSREDFVETQIQFLFAVAFFSRPMAALAGRLPRPEMRLSLLENVHEEHGRGALRFSHERTFLALLARLGVAPEEIERRALWPEIRAFNTTLVGVCALDDTLTALATLGIIEDLFAGISARIGQGIVGRGFLPGDQVVHYAVHEKLDEEHAEGFYRELIGPWAAHPRHAYQIQEGLELGAYAFLALYEGLHRSRGRRWERAVGGPHSLAEGWDLDLAPPASSR
jgi:pyrroloquinoline-quinone synthase